jgi:hypothetical protein
MKKLALIATLVLLPAGPAGGGGAGPGYLTVRSGGPTGPLALYDLGTGRRVLSLPLGLRSADGSTFVSARARASGTVVKRYSLPDGRVVGTRRLPRSLPLVAVSPNGRRLLLQAVAPAGWTRYVVVDGLRITRTISLPGRYEVETLSPDGQRLFLVHWTNSRYDLRNYDLRTNRLVTTPTRSSETGAVEKMQGVATVGIASVDGGWLHTLYVKGDGRAFVHALDLRGGVGHCIDLAVSEFDSFTIGQASLQLSPDQRTLYVALPRAGRIFSIDVGSLEVARTTRFRRSSAFDAAPSSATTPNGRMLYVAAGTSLWAFDTAARRVTGRKAIGAGEKQYALATGVTTDGRRVAVLRADRKLVLRDAATLARLG